MPEFNANTPWMDYALIVVAGIVGYFVVSKLFDFFKKGSAWDESGNPSAPKNEPEVVEPEWQPPPLPPTNNNAPEPDMDAIRKRQEKEYRDWKKRE